MGNSDSSQAEQRALTAAAARKAMKLRARDEAKRVERGCNRRARAASGRGCSDVPISPWTA